MVTQMTNTITVQIDTGIKIDLSIYSGSKPLPSPVFSSLLWMVLGASGP